MKDPVYEFIYYPEKNESLRAQGLRLGPETYEHKIVYTLYDSSLSLTQMQEAFGYFLKACTYHVPNPEDTEGENYEH